MSLVPSSLLDDSFRYDIAKVGTMSSFVNRRSGVRGRLSRVLNVSFRAAPQSEVSTSLRGKPHDRDNTICLSTPVWAAESVGISRCFTLPR